MDAFLQYVVAAAQATGREWADAFGVTFVLAVLLHFTSNWIRGAGGGTFGRLYYWFVAPGVVCHECGHALGCLLTGTKIVEFVPFHPKARTLGYVVHEERRGLFGAVAELVVATGPVWLGCAALALVVGCCLDAGFAFPETVRAATPFSAVWGRGLLAAASELFARCCMPWRWASPWQAFAYWFAFCVASEMSLSLVDLKQTWKGALALVSGTFLLNLVPGFPALALEGLHVCARPLFFLHVLLGFALLVTLAVYLAVGVLLVLWNNFGARTVRRAEG